jgi:anti-sigma28 factor (negative regulator of flagellin synthesis)
MSIRIQNDPLSQIGSLSQTSSQRPSSRQNIPGQDNVELSSISESIGAALSAQDASRTSRVRQLSALYSGGQYNVDSGQISHALIASAIGYPAVTG